MMTESESDRRRYTLSKSARLRLRSLVENLFSHGKSIYDFPLRAIWHPLSQEELTKLFRQWTPRGVGRIQMMVTVPKKKRRHAVDRVLLRRRIREAYRLNRHILDDTLLAHPEIASLQIAFIYIHTENLEYKKIEKRMVKILTAIKSSIEGKE